MWFSLSEASVLKTVTVTDNVSAMFMCIAPFVFVKVSVYPVLSALSVRDGHHCPRPSAWGGAAPPDATSDARDTCWPRARVSAARPHTPLLSAPVPDSWLLKELVLCQLFYVYCFAITWSHCLLDISEVDSRSPAYLKYLWFSSHLVLY